MNRRFFRPIPFTAVSVWHLRDDSVDHRYATGLIAFVREVAARTEQYWCPIKHAGRAPGHHPRHRHFAAYGDERDYRRRLSTLRDALANKPAAARGRRERP